uniref:NADH-ubiquinone oxidoreductase chain 5 n=1 Tax=Porcellio dilatatus dilatatus TaxID=96810 RepID=A0A1P8DKF7_PORDI|nr:NADH dehydrogenase subunit 5 [Porcellio dilatatus dilatatus]
MEKESYWSSYFLAMAMIISCIFSLMFILSGVSVVLEWSIMVGSSVDMLFNFYMDWVSLLFFSFISLISSAVLFYSKSYMGGDKKFRVFMVLVIFFVISMFFLVFSLNLVSMMLGWDGLGVVSYILVIFYGNEKSNSAGMITALSNRVGDAALLMAIAWFLEEGSWSYMFTVFLSDEMVIWMISLAAITKSAQIPFSAWLPAAMAAPTPVSALVHSSTLVTAGVYLLIRFSGLLEGAVVMKWFIYLGVLTTMMASVSALFEVDFKKIVALSTLSQLGVMISTLAMGLANLAYIHLLTHAVFKALLFMCSGKVIHMVGDSQNVRKMGGNLFNLPVTSMVMSLSSFALCGVPFMSGFYSKDLIIESAEMMDNCFMNYIMYMMVVGLSASYSFRLIFLSIIKGTDQGVYSTSGDKDWVMLGSKMGLIVMSTVSGAVLLWLVMPSPAMVCLSFNMKMLSLFSMSLGFAVGLVLSFMNLKGLAYMSKLSMVDLIMVMVNLVVLSGGSLGYFMGQVNVNLKSLDVGWLEVFGGQGCNKMLLSGGSDFSVWFTSGVKMFLVIFVISVLIISG